MEEESENTTPLHLISLSKLSSRAKLPAIKRDVIYSKSQTSLSKVFDAVKEKPLSLPKLSIPHSSS